MTALFGLGCAVAGAVIGYVIAQRRGVRLVAIGVSVVEVELDDPTEHPDDQVIEAAAAQWASEHGMPAVAKPLADLAKTTMRHAHRLQHRYERRGRNR